MVLAGDRSDAIELSKYTAKHLNKIQKTYFNLVFTFLT